jgi:hypothetical protein
VKKMMLWERMRMIMDVTPFEPILKSNVFKIYA